MLFGVGTDILLIGRLRRIACEPEDAFVLRTYTGRERAQACERPDPVLYYATRFAGKEAVFKALRIDGAEAVLNQIEILNNKDGVPVVTLLGELAEHAEKSGIGEVLISLSYDSDYAVAFAAANLRPVF